MFSDKIFKKKCSKWSNCCLINGASVQCSFLFLIWTSVSYISTGNFRVHWVSILISNLDSNELWWNTANSLWSCLLHTVVWPKIFRRSPAKWRRSRWKKKAPLAQIAADGDSTEGFTPRKEHWCMYSPSHCPSTCTAHVNDNKFAFCDTALQAQTYKHKVDNTQRPTVVNTRTHARTH